MMEHKILEFVRNKNVYGLNPDLFSNRFMTIEEMKAIFNYFGAFWQYEGEPCKEKPHALLKAGGHSNGFIACKEVLHHPRICVLFANEMFKLIREKVKNLGRIDVIASSAYSAITLGWEVARLISDYNSEVEYIPVEKDENGNPTIIRGGIDSGKNVLIINELMTTGSGSTWETKQAVLKCNGEDPAPQIIEPAFVLVHRSKDITLADGSAVQPVFHFDIENFKPEECPYCKVGSEAIKPKVDDNWKRLHRRIM